MDENTAHYSENNYYYNHFLKIKVILVYLVPWEAHLGINSLYHCFTKTSHVEPIHWFGNIQSKANL